MLKVNDISIGYGGRSVVEGISFEVAPGECVLVCGANGSGKTTLMKTVAGVLKPIRGTVGGDGTMVLVPTGIPKVKGFTLREFVRTGCYSETDIWGRSSKGLESSIDEAIALLGIGHLEDRDISAVSDGEFQKACIASALTHKASVLLLDEPTAFLDVDSRVTVLQALRKVASERNIAVLFSSHDIHESASVCTRIIGVSSAGRFVDSLLSSKEDVLSQCFTSLRKG